MRFLTSSLLIVSIFLFSTNPAQAKEEEQKNKGTLSGGFETNTIYYLEDNAMGNYSPPKNKYGSNNYLKLEYKYGNFSAGIQAEYFPQAIQGYESTLNGFAIPTKYVRWDDKNFSVTVGDFYDQLGSGILFRAYEDRFLGINNSLLGAKVNFNILDYIQGKVFYGIPRNYMGYGRSYSPSQTQVTKGFDFFDTYTHSNVPGDITQVIGGDISFDLSYALGIMNHRILLEGSVLQRMERHIDKLLPSQINGKNVPLNNLSYSARAVYEWNTLSVRGEYIGKQEDIYFNNKTGEAELRPGNAQLLEINYSLGRFTALGILRRLDNMQNTLYRTSNLLPSNTLNYIPALSLQQSYSLALIKPLSAYPNGEIGGQLDLFYNIKRAWKLHVNGSWVQSLTKANRQDFSTLIYRDFTIDVERWWSKKFKSILFVSIQEIANDGGKGNDGTTEAKNVFVADLTYKFTRKLSLRGEFQYLYSQEGTKDWIAAMFELNFAPKWSFYVGDMYNTGGDKLHYYNIGTSFSHKNLRVAANFGRNRSGYVCSGGVCRLQPEYTGANLMLTYLF